LVSLSSKYQLMGISADTKPHVENKKK